MKNFFLPTQYPRSFFDFDTATVYAIIPTYKPGVLTERLVESLVLWNPNVYVYVVDDCTPRNCEESHQILERIAAISDRVVMLRTPVNKLKAGALNHGLQRIFDEEAKRSPDVILTLDDDVVVTPSTVRNLVTELMSYDHLGAACSQCHVLNKNRNFLTRLQGLEYLGFNATRLGDEGFFAGPLVMHGMLTAFKASALREVGGFSEGHLIEDYEITARLKAKGWSVKSVVNSHAWTFVPENLSKLWRQRTRWLYGGVTVVDRVKYLPTVIQDIIGHGMFWATVFTINILIFSIVLKSPGHISPQIPRWIIALSLLQFAIWYVFQIWLMRLYKGKDVYDWMIRLSAVPEFLYSNILSLVLVGAYLFLFFNTLTSKAAKSSTFVARSVVALGNNFFRACGYTRSWGTRTH